MSQDLWTKMDNNIAEMFLPDDRVLDQVLKTIADNDLPPISVSPVQGKFLHLIARIQNAHRILEIGTLAGYSTIWLARALPREGRLITLEIDPKHAEIALENIANAGLSHLVELRLGNAIDTLSQMVKEGCHPFDLIFIDGGMENGADYFSWALKLSRAGTVIIVDNVIRRAAVADTASDDPKVQGVLRLNKLIASGKRVSAIEIQTVGVKGHDGFALALVAGER